MANQANEFGVAWSKFERFAPGPIGQINFPRAAGCVAVFGPKHRHAWILLRQFFVPQPGLGKVSGKEKLPCFVVLFLQISRRHEPSVFTLIGQTMHAGEVRGNTNKSLDQFSGFRNCSQNACTPKKICRLFEDPFGLFCPKKTKNKAPYLYYTLP